MQAAAPPVLASGLVVAASLALIAAAERIFPHRRSWLRSRGDVAPDLAFIGTGAVVDRALSPLAQTGAVALGVWLFGARSQRPWPQHWPLFAQLVLALLVVELVEYWLHRWMHENRLLWRFHATHHSATRLYWLNAIRVHPVEMVLIGTTKFLPIIFLGCRTDVLWLVVQFGWVHGAFQHSNLSLRLGPLNWIFSMAELHRWHHSTRIEEANRNYGGNLIVWDVLFGTRYLPTDREPPEHVGMIGTRSYPSDYLGMILEPFRVTRDSATARSN
jgi:sterol desaturase/sphingolipid hydroxylase (fatty acid hydroxylase superfamily)